jgi:hypothetical protein
MYCIVLYCTVLPNRASPACRCSGALKETSRTRGILVSVTANDWARGTKETTPRRTTHARRAESTAKRSRRFYSCVQNTPRIHFVGPTANSTTIIAIYSPRPAITSRSRTRVRRHTDTGLNLLYHTNMVANIACNPHGTGCGETRRAAQWNSVLLPCTCQDKVATN